MELSFFENLVMHSPELYIRIMGGEPTLHPEFFRLLDIVYAYQKVPIIFSNFLFNSDIKNGIISLIKENKQIKFLVNIAEITDVDTLINNYKCIYNELRKRNRTDALSCGVTINSLADEFPNVSYIESLIKLGLNVESLRFCMMAPNTIVNKIADIKGNYKIGDTLKELCNFCNEHHLEKTIPEEIYPCTFSNIDDFYFVKQQRSSEEVLPCYIQPPLDVFPDGTVSFCFPLKEKTNMKITDFDHMKIDVIRNYNKIKTISPTCTSCKYYKIHCNGACPAWR